MIDDIDLAELGEDCIDIRDVSKTGIEGMLRVQANL